MTTEREVAVVAGGSVGGLLAALALSEAFDRVIVLERDRLPDGPHHRRGVPQDRHINALLPRGRELLEELLPGFARRLRDAGAPTCRLLEEARFAPAGRELARGATGLEVLQASRPLLEAEIRSRVAGIPNVEVCDGCAVDGLVVSDDGRRVTGVRIGGDPAPGGDGTITASLVVDATGRVGRAQRWMEGAGGPHPPEERLHVGVGYSSVRLHIDAEGLGGDTFVGVAPVPGRPTGAFLSALEGDEHVLTASGYAGHRPPSDLDGLLRFAAGVLPPDLGTALRGAVTVGDVAVHRVESYRWRRYDRLRHLPRGLIVVGDALATFNPIYGQGTTVAAAQAHVLRRCLEDGDDALPRRFHRAAARVIRPAWAMATGADLTLPEVEGRRTVPVRLANRYVHRLLDVATHDDVVAAAFMRANGMVAPPSSLLHPSITARVLGPGARPWRAADETTEHEDVAGRS